MLNAHEAERVRSTLESCIGEERRQKMEWALTRRLSGLTILLEHPIDPHNGAAVLRSAEAMGLSAVHVVEGERRFEVSVRITQGCERWLEITKYDRTDDAMARLRGHGFQLAAAVPGVTSTLDDIDFGRPVALLLGNEHRGLSQEAIQGADVSFCLQMFGMTQSLNLSVAAAVSLAHATRARRKALGQDGDLSAESIATTRASWYLRELGVRYTDLP